MKQIDISTKKHPNTFTLVDDCDYKRLNKHKWYVAESRSSLYVVRGVWIDGKCKILKMHIEIMGRVEGKMIDHRSGITLDNQRHNLRHCTRLCNAQNRKINANSTSGYKGVTWHKHRKKWEVRITCNQKVMFLGYFFCLIKGAKAYDKAAIKYHGEFARLNFPITDKAVATS